MHVALTPLTLKPNVSRTTRARVTHFFGWVTQLTSATVLARIRIAQGGWNQLITDNEFVSASEQIHLF